MENQTVELTTEQTTEQTIVDLGMQAPAVQKPADMPALNYKAALAAFSAEEQKEIIDLSNAVNLEELDKILSFGSAPFLKVFEQSGKFLKEQRGSEADKKVIAEVIELSKKAADSSEDYNLVFEEPGFFQKLYIKLLKPKDSSQVEKLEKCAITSYNLITELFSAYDAWIEMEKKTMGDIGEAIVSDFEASDLLAKYIIAGNLAKERIQAELEELQKKYNETGLAQYGQKYKELKLGYDKFIARLQKLEEGRFTLHLSLAQLDLIKESNVAVQSAIISQKDASMMVLSQQLRNGIMAQKNREVIDGQKSITKLNNELIVNMSKIIGTTAEEAERLMYASIYDIDAAKQAVTTVITACKNVQNVATEMLPKLEAETAELNKLLEELKPCVESAENAVVSKNNVATTTSTTTGKSGGRLVY